MSLRMRLTVIFVALGVVPLILVGVLEHRRTTRALEELVTSRTEEIGQRSASEIAARYADIQSKLRLFGENFETVSWLEARAAGDAEALNRRRASAVEYLDAAWAQLGRDFIRIELFDADGERVSTVGDPDAATAVAVTDLRLPISPSPGKVLGEVSAVVATAGFFETDLLGAGFGRGGYQVVVDGERAVVVHGSPDRVGSPPWPGADAEGAATVRFEDTGTRMVASNQPVSGSPWVVSSVASLDEFAGPFDAARQQSLTLLLLIAALVSVAFLVALRRATRSLNALTVAAERVGLGAWPESEDLPPPGADEVGQLSSAFSTMADELRSTITRLERSRQLAVLGEFSSRIAHELRNPLTSVKLNLQRLERRVLADDHHAALVPPLGIAMKEVRRLETIAGGVLGLARPGPAAPSPVQVGPMLDEVLAALDEELAQAGVRLECCRREGSATALVEGRGLREAVINLLLNAAEAAGRGGIVRVEVDEDRASAGSPCVTISVSDSGPGVPEELRDRVFDPFFTSRSEGTGLGLAITARVVEDAGGDLTLEPSGAMGGATFRIRLPLLRPAEAG